MKIRMNYTALHVAAANASKNVTKHLIMNATRPRAPSVASRGVIVFHNETFGVLGLKQDVEAPLWSGIMAGVVFACVCCTCLAACMTSFSRNVDVPVRYEGIPLITIRHGRR